MTYQEKVESSGKFQKKLKVLLEEIRSNPEKINEMDEDQIREIRKAINPYSHIVGLTGKYNALTFTNMETTFMQYMTLLGMTGFVYKMLEEFDPSEHMKMSDMPMPEGWREYTRNFLNTMFEYNPEDHVRPLKNANIGKKSEAGAKKLKEMNIPMPPADTGHRFKRYIDNHFDQFRSLTAELTGFEPTIEDAIQCLKTFDDEKSAMEWKDKYQDDFSTQIRIVAEGAWALTGPWADNRDKQEYLNEHTQFLADVMDRLEQDEKLGQDMMKKRVEKKKKQNIKEAGPDPKSLGNYIKSTGKKMESLGAKRVTVSKEEEAAMAEKHRAMNGTKESSFVQYVDPNNNADDDDDCPDDAVEVGVTEISGGGKVVTQSKFYTESDRPEDIQKQAKEIQKVRPHPNMPAVAADKVGGRRVAPRRGALFKAKEKALAQRDNDDADADVDDKLPQETYASSTSTDDFVPSSAPKPRQKGLTTLGGKK